MENLLRLVYVLGKHLSDELTMRRLAIEAKIPYTSAVRTLNNHKQLFSFKKKGGLKLVSLNRDDPIVKHHLILAERQAKELFCKQEPLFTILEQDLVNGEYTLLLFGSRAAGTHRAKSDVDLCVINKNGEKNLRFSKFSAVSKLDVNPIFFSEEEFTEMLKDKEHNVGKEILSKHVILYGEEYFWNLVWNCDV